MPITSSTAKSAATAKSRLAEIQSARQKRNDLALSHSSRVKALSRIAFKRMRDSTKYSHYATVWDRLISTLNNGTGDAVVDKVLARIVNSQYFITLYNDVLRSITIPDKARSIKLLARFVNEQLEEQAGDHPQVQRERLKRQLARLQYRQQKVEAKLASKEGGNNGDDE